MKYRCFCCGSYSLENDPQKPTFEICSVCYWENDPIQNEKPEYIGGANRISLNQAKNNYYKYGAIDEKFIEYVIKKRMYKRSIFSTKQGFIIKKQNVKNLYNDKCLFKMWDSAPWYLKLFKTSPVAAVYIF